VSLIYILKLSTTNETFLNARQIIDKSKESKNIINLNIIWCIFILFQ